MNLTGWVLYAFAVSLLVTAAAWCLESGLRRARVPTRWPWAVALLCSIAIPVAGLFSRASERAAPVDTRAMEASSADGGSPPPSSWYRGAGDSPLLEWPAAAIATVDAWVSGALDRGVDLLPTGPTVDRLTFGLWLGGTIALTFAVLSGAEQLARRRRRWPRWEIRGRSVRVAPDMGPAVMGVARPEIVIPTWVVSLPSEDIELVLTHEEEHLRARDPLLLAASLLPLLALPWNPAMWWQLKRLKEAVEVDCDRRVLLRGAAPTRYGRLLLRLGTRGHAEILSAPGIVGSHPHLLRRLEAMRRRPVRGRVPVAVLAAAAAAALFVVALEADTPSPVARVASPAEAAVASLHLGPTFGTESLAGEPAAEAIDPVESASLPTDERLPELPPSEEAPEPGPESAPDPELDEPGELRPQEPVDLEDAPEAHADETPEAASALAPTSPAPVLDEIPTPELVSRSTETEARDLVALETSLPPISAPARGEIPRTTSGSPRTSVAATAGPTSTTGAPRADRPSFGPVEVAPEIRNRAQIQRVLEREYPSLLRRAGVGGTVLIHFLVDDAGEVAEARVVGSSGHLQLDEAALRVAQRFEFAPALSQDGRVPVWIELPITFQAAQ